MNVAMIDVDITIETYSSLLNTVKFYQVSDGSIGALNTESCTYDGISHGSLCMTLFAAGAKKLPDCFILLKKYESGKCNVDDLITAMEWCEKAGVRLISLSAGTSQYCDAFSLYQVVNRLHKQGITLTASASNNRNLTYPACFYNCLGVCVDNTGDMDPASFSYQEHPYDGIEVVISAVTAEGMAINSNSEATAYFAGVISTAADNKSNILKYIKEFSKSYPQRLSYDYAINAIKNEHTDDVPIIAVKHIAKPHISNFISLMQVRFHESEYYALTINPPETGLTIENFSRYVHTPFNELNCSYEEYAQLVIKLCRPSILFLDYDSLDNDSGFNGLLYTNTMPDAKESALQLCMDILTPKEAFEMIINHFNG